jgi:homospermidine synthase
MPTTSSTVRPTIPFPGRLLVLGCGSVAQCTVPLLLRHLDMPADRVTVLEMEDRRDRIADALARGVNYRQQKITPENYAKVLGSEVGPGDLIVDLTWNLETTALLDWCHHRGVRYVNTSVEVWDPYTGAHNKPTTELTLYHRQMAIRKLVGSWDDRNGKGPTAVVDHGANPGLVSHFTKMALIDIARRVIEDKPAEKRTERLREALDAEAFNRLAMHLGVKVIHVSERDTQITNRPKEEGEFVNTWSVEGFYEEGIAPAEMGWGTHERRLPPDARVHESGPRNQICLTRIGMNTWVRSWVPCGEIVGMVIRHGEAFSISDKLTVQGEDGTPLYRPTVHYAYCPCDAAVASLHEMKMRNYRLQERWRIMTNEITAGRDELGCLLMGHDYKSWWIGSLLDIEESRRLVPNQNPTTLQVAGSVLGAVFWMIRNPNEGVNVPDDLPHREIMEIARPYLGPFISRPVDWQPNGYRDTAATRHPELVPADDDPWQFHHFLVTH